MTGEIGAREVPFRSRPWELAVHALGKDWARDQPIFFEHEGNAAIRLDNFKLVKKHGCEWELYDMDEDRTELHNIAGRHAPLERELKKRYQDWADKTGVLDWDQALPRLLEAWGLQSAEG